MPSYSNPVVAGHAPDPSVVRVGDDFYLATSSFGFMPGIPIRHSRNLVDWTIIGHAITRPTQYRRDGDPGPIELFAPTLRHHDGTFYLTTTNAQPGQGNFYVTTRDPAGDWSDAIWIDEEAFDPSLFRDGDGTWYYTRRSLEFGRSDGMLGPIMQGRINIETGELGEMRAITGVGGFVTNDIEGPHLFKRGEWYYLTGAEGSSWKGHLQSIGRSRSPWGPFEACPHNPILSHRDRIGHPIQSLGHADLFDDANGNWWAVSLGTRHAPLSHHHNLGRETFLTPVSWTAEGWPLIGVGGQTELRIENAPLPEQSSGATANATRRATGSTRSSLWLDGWVTLGQFSGRITQRDGVVTVPAGGQPWQLGAPKGMLLRSQTSDDARFEATLHSADAEVEAGIAVMTDPHHIYSLTVLPSQDGARRLRFRRQADDLVTEEIMDLGDLIECDDRGVPAETPVRLRIMARPQKYAFELVVDDAVISLGEGSARLLSAEAVEWFRAAHFSLLAIGTRGTASFHSVSKEPLSPLPPVIVPPFIAGL